MEQVQKLAKTQNETDRLALLHQLVDQLNSKERHALARIISVKNDRLAALPVELVIQILSNLDFLYTWKLQLVCQQWRDILSSEQIVDAALKRWDTHRPEDRVKSSPTVEASKDILRRLQSWRLGRPFTRCAKHIDIRDTGGDHPHRYQASRTSALSGHYFAYFEISPRSDQAVVVLNLVTGTRTRYHGTAREPILRFALSNDIIAYTNFHGKLYTCKHDDIQLGSVQLSSAIYQAFSAERDIVGIVMQARSSRPATVILYNCSNCTMRNFEIEPVKVPAEALPDLAFDPGCSIRTLLISVDARTVDIFGQQDLTTDESGKSQNVYVEHRRYAFDGKYLSSSSWRRTGTRAKAPWPYDYDRFELTDLHHTGIGGHYVFRSPVQQSADQLPSLSTRTPPRQMLLCFDAEAARLKEYALPIDYQQSRGQGHDDGGRANRSRPMLWKNLEIRAAESLYFSTMSDTDRHRIQNRLQLRSRGNERQSQVLVNESFVVATSWLSQAKEWHADIFCFEENLDWAVHGSEVIPTNFWNAAPSTNETGHGE